MMLKSLQSAILILASASSLFLLSTAYAEQPPRPSATQRAIDGEESAKKWETDGAVRLAMENIRQAMASSQTAIKQNSLGALDYRKLADIVTTNLAVAGKDARLAREAQVALHVIVLNDLRRSSELMQTSHKIPMQRVGALGVLQSLRLYDEYFLPAGHMPGMAKAR